METGHNANRKIVGIKMQPARYSFSSHEYDLFQLIYVMEGRLYFQQEEREVKILPGHMAVLRAGSCFNLHTDKDSGYNGIFFSQYKDLPEEFYGKSFVCRAQPVIREIAEIILKHSRQPSPASRALLFTLGESMARLVLAEKIPEDYPEDGTRYQRYWSQCTRQSLDANLYGQRNAGEILNELNLSYRQLARYFFKEFGCSPKQYLIEARLREAELYLRETMLSITSIAFELGYSSSQYFTTIFAQKYGLTPSAFRKQIKK